MAAAGKPVKVDENTQEDKPPKSKLMPQFAAATLACMNAISTGCALGWFSPASVIYESDESTNFSRLELICISASFVLSVAISMVAFSFVVMKIGSRSAIVYTTPFLVGFWLLLLLDNVYTIVVSRVVIGTCGGIGALAALVFIGEMSEPHIRGTLCSIYQIGLTLGVLIIFCFGVLENKYWINCSSALISVLCFCLIFFWESPIYYLRRNNMDHARKALQFYRGNKYDIEPELKELLEYLTDLSNGETTCQVMKGRRTKRAMVITITFYVLQEGAGISTVALYSHKIFSSVFENQKHVSSLALAVTLLLSTILSGYLLEIVGRKILLIVSFVAMMFCHIGLAVFFIMQSNTKKKYSLAVNTIPVILCCLYVITFSLGAGTVPYVFQSEMFPAETKFLGGAIACGLSWLMAFFMILVFPLVYYHVGMGYTFVIFAGFCLVGTFCSIFMVNETKGKTLQKIQEMLEK